MEHTEKFRNTDKVKINPGMVIVMSTVTALALLLIYIAGTGIHQENYAKHGDYIIRYSFTGIENLFHDRYGYYSVKNNKSVEISNYIKKFGNIEEFESVSRYEDRESRWFICSVNLDDNSYDCKLQYDEKDECTAKEYDLFLQLIEELRTDEDEAGLDTVSNQFSIEVVNHTDTNTYLFKYKNSIHVIDNPFGDTSVSFTKIMDMPNNSYFDYIYWLK